jgi:hypothetical protein
MPSIMQPLREEHQELLPQIERLRAVSDLVGDASAETLQVEAKEHQVLTVPHKDIDGKLIARYAIRETMGLVVMAWRCSGRPGGLTGGLPGHLSVSCWTAATALVLQDGMRSTIPLLRHLGHRLGKRQCRRPARIAVSYCP